MTLQATAHEGSSIPDTNKGAHPSRDSRSISRLKARQHMHLATRMAMCSNISSQSCTAQNQQEASFVRVPCAAKQAGREDSHGEVSAQRTQKRRRQFPDFWPVMARQSIDDCKVTGATRGPACEVREASTREKGGDIGRRSRRQRSPKFPLLLQARLDKMCAPSPVDKASTVNPQWSAGEGRGVTGKLNIPFGASVSREVQMIRAQGFFVSDS